MPVALVCTSGSAAAHYLPAIVEASEAGVPLIAITADRPPELQHCGASQTIDQIGIVRRVRARGVRSRRAARDELALRAVRRTIVQAITASRGPQPVRCTSTFRCASRSSRRGHDHRRTSARRDRVRPDRDRAAAADRGSRCGRAARRRDRRRAERHRDRRRDDARCRDDVLALCATAGYPLLAESRQPAAVRRAARRDGDRSLRLRARAPELAPAPKLIIQLGAEPVAAGWPGRRRRRARAALGARRHAGAIPTAARP